jgi:hypothetical protein
MARTLLPTPRTTFKPHFWMFAAIAGLAAAMPAAANAQNRQSTPTPRHPAASGEAVDLATEAFRLESAGLTMYLPVGAVARTNRAGESASVQILPGDASPTWLVNLQTPQSTNTQRTASHIADEVLNQLLASVGVIDRQVARDGTLVERLVSTKGTVIEPVRPLELAGVDPQFRRPGARFYVRLPRGERETAVVRGYTIFRTGPGRFVTFDLVTTEPDFARARHIYETMIATARFEDTNMVAATRGAAIEMGVDFFSRLSPSDYETALARQKDQWYRLARQEPGTSDRDAQEVAYRRIRAWKGSRGELDSKRPRSNWTTGDRQEGYLVRVDARVLRDGAVIDSVGTYFMTTDRREEAWIVQMAVRDPNRRAPIVYTETGARSGSSMSVTTTGTGRENLAATPFIPEQGYATQVENFLLPHLLSQSDVQGEFGFYLYQSETNSVRLRRDTVMRAGEMTTITTRHNEDREPQVSTFAKDGTLVSTVLPDSTTWMPLTLQRLADLWRAKGLPME